MNLRTQPLADHNLDEAIAFVRSANPFAQYTWGWDTGRFIDFRWGNNALRVTQHPDFFARNGTVVRNEGGDIVALILSEVGEDDHCMITASPDPDILTKALDWLTNTNRNDRLIFYPSDDATWIHEVLTNAGFNKGEVAGLEWGYDPSAFGDPGPLPRGFVVGSLSDDRDADYAGIDQCLESAFGGKRDRPGVLRSIEANPMFRPELSIVARAPDGRIAAYCRGTVDADSGVCGIDPVATHADFQGRGLGKAIVRACFVAQARLGGTMSFIGSAPEGSPGSRVYRSLGPASVTSYSTWTRRLPEERDDAMAAGT